MNARAAYMAGKALCVATVRACGDDQGPGFIGGHAAMEPGDPEQTPQVNRFLRDLHRLVREPELIEGYSAAMSHIFDDTSAPEPILNFLERASYEACQGYGRGRRDVAAVEADDTPSGDYQGDPRLALCLTAAQELEHMLKHLQRCLDDEHSAGLHRKSRAIMGRARALSSAIQDGIGDDVVQLADIAAIVNLEAA